MAAHCKLRILEYARALCTHGTLIRITFAERPSANVHINKRLVAIPSAINYHAHSLRGFHAVLGHAVRSAPKLHLRLAYTCRHFPRTRAALNVQQQNKYDNHGKLDAPRTPTPYPLYAATYPTPRPSVHPHMLRPPIPMFGQNSHN